MPAKRGKRFVLSDTRAPNIPDVIDSPYVTLLHNCYIVPHMAPASMLQAMTATTFEQFVSCFVRVHIQPKTPTLQLKKDINRHRIRST